MKLTTNNAPLLLDTCAVIWLVRDEKMRAEANEMIDAAERARQPIFLSPISFLEVGSLIAHGRVNFTAQSWLDRFRRRPGIRATEMPGDLLFRSAFLPGNPPKDPADRVIIQTAREYGYCIVTRDREILEYAEGNAIARLVC